jgi:thiol-disulfide isomerase/thioredoxin
MAQPPETTTRAGVRHVVTRHPAERLVVYSGRPQNAARLLWYMGRAAVKHPRGSVTLDASGAPIRFDRRLHPERLRFRLDGREPLSVAWAGAGGYWVATRDGAVIRVDASGAIVDSAPSGFHYSLLAADTSGRIWAVRSPEQFAFPFGSPEPPLIVPVGHADSVPLAPRAPAVPIFAHLVNAGHLATSGDGGFFFAPFIRDEIIRVGPDGVVVWIASRGLPHGVEEPSFELRDGEPMLDYAPVNLGLTVGPDGLLYVLSTPGFTTSRSRLDVLDPASGVVRRTAELPTALPTIAADAAGRVHLLDELELLTGIAPAAREALRPFDLEQPGGTHVRLDQFRGRVLLVNFWASWCAPCREEMPALDSLRREFATDGVAFLAISDDRNREHAARFIEQLNLGLPFAFGDGKMRGRYHYFGLPFTVLVDRDGRVVERWAGYGGETQIEVLRTLIRAEVARGDPVPGEDAPERSTAPHHQH